MADGLRAEVAARIERLDLPFNKYGLDPYGVSKAHLERFYTLVGWFYRSYFRCTSFGVERVPDKGPVLLIGNHSGGLPVDGGMILASLFLEHEPPIHAHGMVEYFAQRWPFVSETFSRLGQLPGLREHAEQLLRAGRHLMVFPEGARGTGKLYRDRYQLVRFGTGFMRLALSTGAPIVPLAFVGGEEAIPTVLHLKRLAKLLATPYIPVTPYLLPVPLPVTCQIHYGEPLSFDGDGTETDEVIQRCVEVVRERIRQLIDEGRAMRGHSFRFTRVEPGDAAAGTRPRPDRRPAAPSEPGPERRGDGRADAKKDEQRGSRS